MIRVVKCEVMIEMKYKAIRVTDRSKNRAKRDGQKKIMMGEKVKS